MCKNVIYERARFNKRNQLPNESVEQFITEVHRLGDSCEFGEMKEELIRDCLVVGIRDHSLSERLQMEPDLTLDKAKKVDPPERCGKRTTGNTEGTNQGGKLS